MRYIGVCGFMLYTYPLSISKDGYEWLKIADFILSTTMWCCHTKTLDDFSIYVLNQMCTAGKWERNREKERAMIDW